MDNIIEEYILGSLLLEPKWIALHQADIPIDGFSTVTNQTIYRAIISCYETLGDVDPVTCYSTLQNWGQANRIGGIETIYNLVQKIAETDNLPYYVQMFHERWVRQRLGMMGIYIQQESGTDKPIPEVVENIHSQLGKIFKGDRKYTHTIQESLIEIEADIANPDRKIGVSTGFIELDLMTSGFHPGELIIIAALTGMGKTCFINNIMLNAALINDIRVLLFSLEMPHKDNIKRILSAESGIPHDYLRRGLINNVDRYRHGLDVLNSAKITVHDRSGCELSHIRQEIRKHKYNDDVGLVIIDHIQFVKVQKMDRRDLEIGEITSGLKALSMDLNIPIIAISHLNRATTNTQTKRPELSNMKESSSLEQDADVVIFLHRDDYFDENDDSGTIDVIVKKQRKGPTGTIKLNFDKSIMKFSNIF